MDSPTCGVKRLLDSEAIDLKRFTPSADITEVWVIMEPIDPQGLGDYVLRYWELVLLAVTWCGLAVVPLLPRRVVLWLSRCLGIGAYALSGHLRRVGWANLNIAFGDTKPEREKRRILKQSDISAHTLVTLGVLLSRCAISFLLGNIHLGAVDGLGRCTFSNRLDVSAFVGDVTDVHVD